MLQRRPAHLPTSKPGLTFRPWATASIHDFIISFVALDLPAIYKNAKYSSITYTNACKDRLLS